MIKCPQTGRAISTGMQADREKFRCSTVFFARSYCLICQASHEWFAREAFTSPVEVRAKADDLLTLNQRLAIDRGR